MSRSGADDPTGVRSSRKRLHPASIVVGAVVGVCGPALGYAVASAILPVVDDLALVAIAVMPTTLAAATGFVPPWRSRTISLVIGTVCGTAGILALIGGGITALAWLLSDPIS